jgi:hypothetical protein
MTLFRPLRRQSSSLLSLQRSSALAPINRMHLVLFGMQNRTFDSYLAAL